MMKVDFFSMALNKYIFMRFILLCKTTDDTYLFCLCDTDQNRMWEMQRPCVQQNKNLNSFLIIFKYILS